MGIVNTTPDSFYPDSRTTARDAAIERGRSMFDLGADVVDVGGESTRPGAATVSEVEELERVIDVVRELSRHGRVSIDTQKPGVARRAVEAGANIINDVSGTLVELAGELGCSYVAMHRQGDAATMQDAPQYDDVVGEVFAFLEGLALRARASGVRQLWLDPGIGFGKTVEHNLALLASTPALVEMGERYDAGVLIGVSRKRFLGALGRESLDVKDRLDGTIAAEAHAIMCGATMIRAHDVKSAVQLRELVFRPVEEVVA